MKDEIFSPPPKVLVVIINYRTSHLMADLLRSIEEDQVEVAITILDNESTTATYEELLQLDDQRLELMRTSENIGFTGGINYVLNHSSKVQSCDYFFLLNPDALSIKNLISSLFVYLKSDSAVAGVSPKIFNSNGKLWYSGAMLDLEKGKVINNAVREVQGDNSYKVDVFSGCSVLFDIEKVRISGNFNDSLFMYYDEAELSMRLRQRGYYILYIPELEVIHDVSYTTKNLTHLKTYYMTRNKFIVFNAEMKTYYKLYFLLYELAYHVKNRRFINARYHLKGYLDFLRGVSGKYQHH